MSDHYLNREIVHEKHSSGNAPRMREYVQALAEKWWVVAIGLLLAMGYGYRSISKNTPAYVARTVIMIEARGAQVMRGLESVDQTDPRYIDVMNTMIETIHSRTLLRFVVESLNLQDNQDFLSPNPNGNPHSKEEAVEALIGCVNVSLRRNTRLVDIIVQHPNPKMTAILADTIAKEFIRFGLQDRINSARSAAEFLNEQAGKYRETNNASSLESNQNFVLEQLKTLNSRLETARAMRFSTESDLEKAEQLVNLPKELANIPSISKQPTVSAVVMSLIEKENGFTQLSQRYKSLHPKYIAAVSEIAELKLKFNQVLLEAVTVLRGDCKAAKETQEKLEKLVTEQESVSLELDRKAVDYNMLKREAEANRTMYDSMIARMKEIDVSGEIDRSPIKIVENAMVPGAPIRFDKVKIMMTASLMGILLSGGLVIVLMRLNPFVTTIEHVDRYIGIPVIGAIPKWKTEHGPMVLDYFKTTNHEFSEAFRTFRTAVMMAHKKESKTFMICSAVPNEGKTFITSCLGVAFAQVGFKTLLIDADLRKRSLSRRIFGKKEHPGLHEFLDGRATFEEILQPTGVGNCFLITGGERADNSAELLRKNALQPLIETALKSFDKIVIDSPPVLSVSDALILAVDIETVYLTAWSGKSHRLALTKACDILATVGKTPSGIILNAIQQRSRKFYYYDYGHDEPSMSSNHRIKTNVQSQ